MTVTRVSWLFAAAFAVALGIVATGQQPATLRLHARAGRGRTRRVRGELRRVATARIWAATTKRRSWPAATSWHTWRERHGGGR